MENNDPNRYDELDQLVESWSEDDWLFVLYLLAAKYTGKLRGEIDNVKEPTWDYEVYALRAMHDSITTLDTIRSAIEVDLWGASMG